MVISLFFLDQWSHFFWVLRVEAWAFTWGVWWQPCHWHSRSIESWLGLSYKVKQTNNKQLKGTLFSHPGWEESVFPVLYMKRDGVSWVFGCSCLLSIPGLSPSLCQSWRKTTETLTALQDFPQVLISFSICLKLFIFSNLWGNRALVSLCHLFQLQNSDIALFNQIQRDLYHVKGKKSQPILEGQSKLLRNKFVDE